jgi:hypothetical protein
LHFVLHFHPWNATILAAFLGLGCKGSSTPGDRQLAIGNWQSNDADLRPRTMSYAHSDFSPPSRPSDVSQRQRQQLQQQALRLQRHTHMMAAYPSLKEFAPRSFVSSYATRLRAFGNPLLTPVYPQANVLPPSRTTKRGTTAINYAEDGYDDDDFEDSEGPRRLTGLRSLRRDDSNLEKKDLSSQQRREIHAPIEIQGIWRDWMGKPKRALYVPRAVHCDKPLRVLTMQIRQPGTASVRAASDSHSNPH